MSLILASLAVLGACSVTDGDTLRCGEERVRLIGIDAPELNGCPRGRRCVEGDGEAASGAMIRAVRGKRLTIERLGQDTYGRTLGVVYADGVNLSCTMLAAGQAEYVERWDNGGRVARDCPDLALRRP